MGYLFAVLAVAFSGINAMLLRRQLTELEQRVKSLEQILIVEEYRCPDCAARTVCPTANSGNLFPCDGFRREDLYSS